MQEGSTSIESARRKGWGRSVSDSGFALRPPVRFASISDCADLCVRFRYEVPDFVKICQHEKGELMHEVFVQAAIPNFPVSKDALHDVKRMLYRCSLRAEPSILVLLLKG